MSAREAVRERRREERIETAAVYCADILTEGWRQTVAERATTYVTETTWRALVGRRRNNRCRILAQVADAILKGKEKAHDLVGAFVSWVVSLATGDQIVRAFSRELATKIPLPYEARLTAVARGVQVTGVLLCLVNGDELTRCGCFVQLALAETKTAVRKILLAALNDWTGLAAFAPKESPHPIGPS